MLKMLNLVLSKINKKDEKKGRKFPSVNPTEKRKRE
jgi:hypothetical protein